LNLGPPKFKAELISTGTHLVRKHTVTEISVPNTQSQKDHVHRTGECGWLKVASAKEEEMLKRLLRLTVYCMKTQNSEQRDTGINVIIPFFSHLNL
jgi:hypothetical protein